MGCKPSTQRSASSSSAKNHTIINYKTELDGLEKAAAKDSAEKLLVLLVFPKKGDPLGGAYKEGARQLGHEVETASDLASAVAAYEARCHQLVIIDLRSSTLIDAELLSRSIRGLNVSNSHTVLMALVRRGYYKSSTCKQLLELGIDRVVASSTSIGRAKNELVQIGHEIVRNRDSFVATSSIAYAALTHCKQLIQITDAQFLVQYVNNATEQFLNYKLDEIRGKNLLESGHNTEHVAQQIQQTKEWIGGLWFRRRSGDSVLLKCRVYSNDENSSSRSKSHYIFIGDPSPVNDSAVIAVADGCSSSSSVPGGGQVPRGSLHSIRKGSYDVKSLASESGQSLRRQSLAKLNSLPIEAPITRLMTLLCSAYEQSAPSVQRELDKVLDILRHTELYSPQLKENRLRPDDPVTVDLISALLSQSNIPISGTRRSSNDSASVIRSMGAGESRGSASSRASLAMIQAPGQLQIHLEQALSWELDIFRLEEIAQHNRPLVPLGISLLCHFNVPATLGCDEKTMLNWLTVVEMHYRSSNSYHNSTHAADVMQASACYLTRDKLTQLLDPLDAACCLIAACCHDIDHPGKSSAFLCNSDHDLAILYNDQCVLESHHAAVTFKLTLADDRVNIFKGLERETYKVARQSIIDMILATEMTKHYEHLAKFVNVFTKPDENEDGTAAAAAAAAAVVAVASEDCPNHREDVALIKRMLIKCADVSNPTRPLKLCIEWARRIAEEYFNQTDEEKTSGLPVVMPMFDRATCSIPKSQIGFIDFIINDMMEAWDAFIELPEMLYYLRKNYQFWKEKEEQGITTIAELMPAQRVDTLITELDENAEDQNINK